MDFEIKRTITIEYPDEFLRVDLNKLEQFISDRLKGQNYGSSVVKYFWGFDLYKFNGAFADFLRIEVESWKHSVKWLVTNSNFDWNVIKDLDENETFGIIHKEMLASVQRIDRMNRKPRDFNYERFRMDLDRIMTDYSELNT